MLMPAPSIASRTTYNGIARPPFTSNPCVVEVDVCAGCCVAAFGMDAGAGSGAGSAGGTVSETAGAIGFAASAFGCATAAADADVVSTSTIDPPMFTSHCG